MSKTTKYTNSQQVSSSGDAIGGDKVYGDKIVLYFQNPFSRPDIKDSPQTFKTISYPIATIRFILMILIGFFLFAYALEISIYFYSGATSDVFLYLSIALIVCYTLWLFILFPTQPQYKGYFSAFSSWYPDLELKHDSISFKNYYLTSKDDEKGIIGIIKKLLPDYINGEDMNPDFKDISKILIKRSCFLYKVSIYGKDSPYPSGEFLLSRHDQAIFILEVFQEYINTKIRDKIDENLSRS